MNEMTTLANIERRISFHIQGAYANILEVGRCHIVAWADMLIADVLHGLISLVPLVVAVVAVLCVWAHRKAKKQ